MEFKKGLQFAREMDSKDPLKQYRDRFHIPKGSNGNDCIYLCGNSLGLQPKSVRSYVEQELSDWEKFGVEGHFHASNPWMPYHELLTEKTAKLVGAKPIEVVTMNTLTVNLHLLMVSFYRPTPARHKILIEANAFPSDQYAVKSQIRFHGFDPETALFEIAPLPGETTITTEQIDELLEFQGDDIALILLGGVNYYSGQVFNMKQITRAGQNKGCVVGFDLAHAVGNIALNLHQWQVDFAVWCNYKYMNGGPGCIAGAFVHEKHAHNSDLPKLSGWWGHEKETRFLMGPEFKSIPGAEGWQMSNPPILPMAALRAALDIFDEVGMDALCSKSNLLTSYLEFLIHQIKNQTIAVITPAEPQQRGCQLSLRISQNGKQVHQVLQKSGVICDWREPDVLRVAPVPLYNKFTDVYHFIEILSKALQV